MMEKLLNWQVLWKRTIALWRGDSSLLAKVLFTLGNQNLMPSRILRESDGNGVSLYFFKPMEDAYALIVVFEEEEMVLVMKRESNDSLSTEVVDHQRLYNWVGEIVEWLKVS